MIYQDAGYLLKQRRRCITVTKYTSNAQYQGKGCQGRSCIKSWNEGMSRRLRAYIENFREDFTIMVTLTYGNEYPKSGKVIKAQLRALFERMRRRKILVTNSFVWWLEFQERGAPHFHMVGTGWVPKEWLAKAWAEITNGNQYACSRVEALRNPDSAGAYAAKYACKAEQKALPSHFEDVGRWWGCVGPRIKHGVTRQPSVAAVTTGGRLPVSWHQNLSYCIDRFGIRVVYTLSGATIYGSERAIKWAASYLLAGSAFTDLNGASRARTLHQTWEGLRSTH